MEKQPLHYDQNLDGSDPSVRRLSDQLNLEMEVLSAAVWNSKALPIVMEQLEPEDFETPITRQAFCYIRQQFLAGECVEKSLLRGKIPDMVWLGLEPTWITNVSAYCKQLRENTRVRLLREMGQRLLTADGEQLDNIVEDGISRLVRRDGFAGIDLASAASLAASERQKGTIAAKMIDLPWSKVNACVRGLHAGWICILAGRPGHGKTAAAIEIALSAAKQHKKVLFVTLEMDAQELAVRVAQRFGLDSEHYYMGGMDETDWKAVDEASRFDALKNIQIEYADTMAKITSLVRVIRPQLVVIDYVQLIKHEHRDRVEGMTLTSNALKHMARRYNVPVLALSQLSRAPKDMRGQIPVLSDLRDSGALEQDADQVIFVWQHEDPQHHIVTGQGVFVVAKARMGKVGKQAFTFQGAKQVFVTE